MADRRKTSDELIGEGRTNLFIAWNRLTRKIAEYDTTGPGDHPDYPGSLERQQHLENLHKRKEMLEEELYRLGWEMPADNDPTEVDMMGQEPYYKTSYSTL